MNVLKDIEVRLEYCHVVAGTKNELVAISSDMFLCTSLFLPIKNLKVDANV